MTLSSAPARPVGPDGPRIGTYRGALEHSDLAVADRGAGLLTRWLREKHWQYVAVADDRLAVGGAIVDAGLVGTTFWWALDRITGDLRVDRSHLVPPQLLALSDEPTAGRVAGIRLGRNPMTVERAGERVAVRGSTGSLALSIDIVADPADAVTAICPVAGGHPSAINITQKEVTTAVSGTATVGDRRHTFDGAVALLDHTHGLLARETTWQWAMGCGRHDGDRIGFNLVAGFNDGLENACWIGDSVQAVGAAQFEQGAETWHVTTEDGTIDLELAVEATRTEDTDVGVLASFYRQPIGTWSGTIDGRSVEGCFGVAEDHRARW